MTATPTALPGVNMFTKPVGKEYTLQWSAGAGRERKGTITMTDFLFNHYFYPTAFGWDGAADEKTVRPSKAHDRELEIGGKTVAVKQGQGYTLRLTPTRRSGGLDAGTQLYLVDGDDVWNFEISGRLTEFRIWLQSIGVGTNLKRPIFLRTATGVASGAAPTIA